MPSSLPQLAQAIIPSRYGRKRYRRVEARTSTGLSYYYWQREMPPIPDRFLDSVVYLYLSEEDARAGFARVAPAS
jgi:hypothetical protein